MITPGETFGVLHGGSVSPDKRTNESRALDMTRAVCYSPIT